MVLLAVVAGCRTNDTGTVRPRDGGAFDTPMTEGGGGGDTGPTACIKDLVDKRNAGQACGCNDECRTGFCAQGVCCNSACDGVCQACNRTSGPGVCGPIAAGQQPATPAQCKAEAPDSCGLDGKCDGAGACRKYPDGSICAAGACQGSAVIGAKICNGGSCVAGPATACSPYACDSATGRCFASCTLAAQCDGRGCTAGSCGQKPLGATCSNGTECVSGSCADGVCCNLACNGPCVSCNQVGRMGECSPVSAGNPDPHSQCKVEAASTCGSSGLCNGVGGCAKFAAGTECRAATCTNGSELPSATCDGEGVCGAGTAIPCAPFQCGASACRATCATNADCVAPNVCTAGSCGKKPNGQTCNGAGDCQSGFCVDGVCCNDGCVGTCVSCALSSTRGRCTNVPAGTVDPRMFCQNKGAASCETNGKCNGNKGCQSYPAGTVCKAASCNAGNNNATQASTCVDGACRTPTATSCAPFKCGGTSCAIACGSNADCVAPNTCIDGSCGKKPLASNCGSTAECAQGLTCSDGVCCSTACTAGCFSCAILGSIGQCVPVAAGQDDPKSMCATQAAATCGTTGKCNGGGACAKHPATTMCGAATCTNGSAKGASFCDGLGTCNAGNTTPCAPFTCNAGGDACAASCTADAQCVAPNKCVGNTCGLSPIGATCTGNSDCAAPGLCVDGACCASACTEPCKSCGLDGFKGACTNIAVGEFDSACPVTAESTCGTDGKCNGAGACSKWPDGTSCRSRSCSGTTETPAAACAGGTCPAATTISCGTFTCDGTSQCRATCTQDNHCSVGMCDTGNGSCGKKGLGIACAGNGDCINGQCVDGVCCASAACGGECSSCAVPGSEGTCANVPNNGDDPDTCQNENTICGRTGKCDGSGGCKTALALGASCGSVCAAGGAQARTCDGARMCVDTGAPVDCGDYACDAGACKTACAGDPDCATGKTCAAPPVCQ